MGAQPLCAGAEKKGRQKAKSNSWDLGGAKAIFLIVYRLYSFSLSQAAKLQM